MEHKIIDVCKDCGVVIRTIKITSEQFAFVSARAFARIDNGADDVVVSTHNIAFYKTCASCVDQDGDEDNPLANCDWHQGLLTNSMGTVVCFQ